MKWISAALVIALGTAIAPAMSAAREVPHTIVGRWFVSKQPDENGEMHLTAGVLTGDTALLMRCVKGQLGATVEFPWDDEGPLTKGETFMVTLYPGLRPPIEMIGTAISTKAILLPQDSEAVSYIRGERQIGLVLIRDRIELARNFNTWGADAAADAVSRQCPKIP